MNLPQLPQQDRIQAYPQNALASGPPRKKALTSVLQNSHATSKSAS
jgi:hypothetical protein